MTVSPDPTRARR